MAPADLPESVLVVGSGGREHALVRSLSASARRPRLLCAPGNAGIAAEAACFAVAADDVAGLAGLAAREKAGFVVVGPEVPLALGLVDLLSERGIPAYGPKAAGARLESSKAYTKEILLKHGIPTAAAATFDSPEAAIAWIRAHPDPVVVKADGLAAGKGVVVASSQAEAETAVEALFRLPSPPGVAGPARVLLEERLEGPETSILVVVSGRDYAILPSAQDHKRIGDGDTGPNTGGMGAVSPAPAVPDGLLARIEREIVRPSVEAIAAEGIDFRGTLFIGLMLTAAGPRVLEFNTRFGDPETQAVLPRLDCDVLELLWAATRGRLGSVRVAVKEEASICVVLAAGGYPEAYRKGDPIQLPSESRMPPATAILHAGTARDPSGRLVTNGGRVLGVTALGATPGEASERAYALCGEIRFANGYYRRDIGGPQTRRPS